MEIERTDVDGLTAFVALAPGPAQAWLAFRVGTEDETLLTRGITRLVGGLATHEVRSGDGVVWHHPGGPTTAIHLNGTRDEVVTMLRRIWEALDSPVEDRLEEVRAEALMYFHWPRPDLLDYQLAQRYGPRGIGLSGQRELGLHHVDAGAVAGWRDRFFGTRNAALALKNVAPEDLRLPARPEGEWRPQAPPDPLPLPLPAWSDEGQEAVTVASVGPGSAVFDAFSAIAAQRLRRRLPGDGDHVKVWTTTLVPGLRHFSLRCSVPSEGFVRSLRDRLFGEPGAARVRDALLEELGALATTGPDPGEVAVHQRELRQKRDDLESELERLEWTPHHHLMDPKGIHRGALDDDEPPSVDAVREVARAALDSAIYEVPPGMGMPPGYHFRSGSSPDRVSGRTYERVGGGGSLVVGDDGVTVTIGDRHVTIYFDRCEAMALDPNGPRDLFGSDGFGARVDPAEWVDAGPALDVIDERLRDRTVVIRPRAK